MRKISRINEMQATNMKKLTKAPWCLQSQGTGEPLSIMGQDNSFICRMDEGSFEDAALIAAAPELLEACKTALRLLLQRDDNEDYTIHTVNDLSVAIRKAEGWT